MKTLFWLSNFIIFYTYIGYGILLYLLLKIKRAFYGKPESLIIEENALPSLTLIVAAYNEMDIMDQKIANTFALDYPKDRLKLLFVTDGSTDDTAKIIQQYPEITLLHSPERKGKINAVHRAVETVKSEIIVFTDANTLLNSAALLKIVRNYKDPNVGAVAGEKRVQMEEKTDAVASEGLYWKYESLLKKWDSEFYSVVGAAGELFSVRNSLYQKVEPDTILDDFMISMLIAKQGYRIAYEPEAFATELSSENVTEELKRKVRIAAGGIQSILRLKSLLLPFKQPLLSFQYLGHRVLRWTITPFLMLFSFFANVYLVVNSAHAFYSLILGFQIIFYSAAILGAILQQRKIKVKALFVPYYFCMMNYAVFLGIFRYFFGTQSSAWERSKRKV